MRSALPLPVLLLVGPVALGAEDARVAFLSRQLATAKDPRLRSQTVLLLGQTQSPSAVGPLCGAMKDGEPVVRAAAATALGELRLKAALTCLGSATDDADPGVRAQVAKAVAMTPLDFGSLYVKFEPVQDRVGTLSSEQVALAGQLARDKLSSLKAVLAPADEQKKAADQLVKARNLKAYQVRLQLLPGSTDRALKVEMLVMSYPDQALKGSWNVRAAGGKTESLLKAMVPRVLDDAAADLAWRTEDK